MSPYIRPLTLHFKGFRRECFVIHWWLCGRTSGKHLECGSCIYAVIKYKLRDFPVLDCLSYTLLLERNGKGRLAK